MARPRIGIFGALVAVGGVLAWRWAQKHRASQARLAGELNRWEAEGGALASTTQEAPSTLGSDVSPGAMSISSWKTITSLGASLKNFIASPTARPLSL